ncbi:MAG: TIGR01777 family protein [Desulfomonile tiedjei]|uniref:TIGR01777 family protein n=1 Tax=Desulfomonile tiedjei TaxID=2358 RepID=A0A9D6V448_9BACT|nr:TIGR01777 family protein [Desulfomonile tiedjei]
MKIFITGANGFVGSNLIRFFLKGGHQITALVRSTAKMPSGFPQGVTPVTGDPTKSGSWQDSVSGHDVLINLAGASIFQRWDEKYKQLLRDSRILTTRNLVAAIPADTASSVTLLSTSAVGYYGPTEDQELGEDSPPGDNFLARLAIDWEAEALRAVEKGARVVITRFGVVLGRGGGALQQMTLPFRLFVGGPLGSGLQWFSWIHLDDLCRAAQFVIENRKIHGPINFTAPQPIRNKELARAIGNILGRPYFVPAPGFMIKLIMGEFGSVLLEGQRVVPRLLESNGFRFDYPTIQEALGNLLQD